MNRMPQKKRQSIKMTHLNGSNITLNMQNKNESKRIKKHSMFIFKQLYQKMTFAKLMDQDNSQIIIKQPIQQPIQKPNRNSFSGSKSLLPLKQINYITGRKPNNIQQKNNRIRHKKVTKSICFAGDTFEKDQHIVINNGWKQLVQKNRLSHHSFKKIKQSRFSLKNRNSYSTSLQNNSKQGSKQTAEQITKILDADPVFLCNFATGFTQDHQQDEYQVILSLKKADQFIQKSQYLQRLYKKIADSNILNGISQSQLRNNFKTLVYLLQTKRRYVCLSDKHKLMVKKFNFVL